MNTLIRSWVPAFLVAVFLVACATTMTGRRQLRLLPDSTMNEMGISAFTQMKAEGKVDADPKTNAYVKCVANAVIKVIPNTGGSKGAAWEVVVFEDETPNAFALPGGKIGVHTGMLDIAKTPGQLAAVLGHEVGHVLLRHGNERASQTILAETGMAIGSVAVKDMSPTQQNAILGGLGLGAQVGVLLPFSRKHESEADTLGQGFMADAGFDPGESVALWQSMAAASQGQPPEFMSTHPAHETRIANLKKGLPAMTKRYKAALAAGKKPGCVPPPPPPVKAPSSASSR